MKVFADRPIRRPLGLEELIAIGARDRSAAVRRIATEARVTHDMELADLAPLVAAMRQDKSASVQERIDFLVLRRAH